MTVKYEQNVLVTPSLARQWLDKNAENNRRPKRSKVPGYARDMLSGNWNSATGETIKFDEDDRLIDGQNRLLAVIEAGVSVCFDIARGLPRSAMLVLDSGAARTGSDTLKIASVSDRARSASIVRWSILWDAKIFTGRGGSLNPTNTEILARFKSQSGLYDAATRRGRDCQRANLANGSSAGMAYYLFTHIDGERTQAFFDQLISGANLPDKSSVLALLRKLARVRIDRLTPAEQLALFVRAWNAKDKPIDRLAIVSRGELNNLNFPQPK